MFILHAESYTPFCPLHACLDSFLSLTKQMTPVTLCYHFYTEPCSEHNAQSCTIALPFHQNTFVLAQLFTALYVHKKPTVCCLHELILEYLLKQNINV